MEPRQRSGGGRGDNDGDGVRAGGDAARAFDVAVGHLTEQQQLGVRTPAPALCILAGAGSGKTSVLTLRVARRILDGSAEADHTVVCTFTRRAARELRDRLRRYDVPVSTPATRGGAPTPGVRAGTLHQLALTLLRRRALDAGRPPPAVSDARYRLIRDSVGDPALASALATEIG
ncbi:MAG: UvrD-helicase domain-containing protein, partial [Acidimicrobiales bacterium]